MADDTTGEQDAAAVAAAAAADTATRIAAAEEHAARAETQLAAALESTREALRAANPDLPPSAFEGADFTTLDAAVTFARTIRDHVIQQRTDNPATRTPAGAGVQRQTLQIPDNARGITRIAFALNNPGPGMTE